MNRRDAKNAMKMPLTMGALPDDIEQMRRIREERQSGRELPLNMRSMPDDAGRNRDASRDLPLNMRSMPDDAGGDRSAINRLTDEQMRDTDPESPFLLRPDRLLAMGVPAELVPIVDEHLGDIPSNSTEEVLAIEDIINMYSHLLEESDLSNKPVFNEVADNIGSSARPVGSGSTSNEEIERYWRAMNSVGSGSGSGSTSNEEFEKYKRAMGMERAD